MSLVKRDHVSCSHPRPSAGSCLNPVFVPAYTRLGKVMNRKQRAQHRGRPDESSGDELADTAVLYNVPHDSARLPSSHSFGSGAAQGISRPKSSRSNMSIGDSTNKPLPPTPTASEHEDPFPEARPVLAKKTTNMKVPSTKDKQNEKLRISPPVLQKTTNSAIIVPDSGRPETSHTTQSSFAPQTSISEATDLSHKISNLMAQAAAQEQQTSLKTNAYAAASLKDSPIERGRNAFAKATRAIKERLSNGSVDRSPKTRRPPNNRHSSFHGADALVPPATIWQYEVLNGLSRERLDRRIAEGENLSNPKIKSLTGDGNIPRKPLPVYESMRTRSVRSTGTRDPSSDDKEGCIGLPREDYSGFDFAFGKQNRKSTVNYNTNTKTDTGLPMETDLQVEETMDTPGQNVLVSEQQSGFSNVTSGLAQHPDTLYFSSPPLGHSTPRIRLEPQSNVNEGEQSRQLDSVRSSTYDDLEDDVSLDIQLPHRKEARLSDGSSLSIKRKEATGDLRAQLTPVTKKAKRESFNSEEDREMMTGVIEPKTSDERVPLSPNNGRMNGSDPAPKASKRKGMGLFDIGKGKAQESNDDDGVGHPTRTRLSGGKRSSFSRPNSSLFSRGRSSRAGISCLAQSDTDSMDIDELQIDDAAYQIGGKR